MALSGSSPPKAPGETLGAVHWTMRRPSLEAFIGMYMESAMSRPKMLASQSSVSPMMLMHCVGVVRCTGHGHPEWQWRQHFLDDTFTLSGAWEGVR